VTPCYRRAEPS